MLFDMLLLAAAQGGATATLAATQAPNVAGFTATVDITGTLAATQNGNVASISANVGTPSTEGTFAATQQPNVMSMSGAVSLAGALAATQQPNTASITALEGDAGVLAATQKPNVAGWGATVWNATSLPTGAAFHLSAAALPVVADGTALASWVESISGLNATQPTAGKQPKFRTSRSGGRQAVQFEGGEWMALDATLNTAIRAIIDSGNFTFVVAFANAATTSIGSLIGASGGSTAFNLIANGAYAGRYDGNVSGHTLPWTVADFATIGVTSETATAGNYGGMATAFERDYFNGAPYRSTNSVIPPSTSGVGIGAQNDTGSGAGKFDILDIVIYPTARRPWEMAQAHVALTQLNNQPLPWGGIQRFDATDGDSVGDGVGVDAYQEYAYLMATARGRKPGQWANFSIGSIRVDQNTAKFQEVADFVNYIGLPANINFFEYINAQNANQTSATIFANVKAYLANGRHLLGGSRFNIGDSTCYGRDVTDRLYASYRGVFNGLMSDPTTGIAPLADAYSPISTNIHIGDGNAFATYGATYIQGDTVHPNAAGHVELEGVMVVGNNALDVATASFGSVNTSSAPGTAAITAAMSVAGVLAVTGAPDTASFTGTVVDPGVVAGTLIATQQPNTMAPMTASVLVGGVLAATATPGVADLSGVVIDPPSVITGTLSATATPGRASIAAHVSTPGSLLTLSEIMTLVLGDLVDGRVWQDATPDNLPRDVNGNFQPFILWSAMGGQDSEYVDQTMPNFSNARVQVTPLAPGAIVVDRLAQRTRDTLLASAYTVGVLGSPVGTYDADRKLRGRRQLFSIWFRQT